MSICIVNTDLPHEAKTRLSKDGFIVYDIPPCINVDSRIASHPDIQICITDNSAYCHPHIDASFADVLSKDIPVFQCTQKLSHRYPDDCAYNIACIGRFALYKKGIIPHEIENAFRLHDLTTIDIPQGYARCSIIPVDDRTIATEDEGIIESARTAGLNVIPLAAGLIPLKGFQKGFAGGAFGLFNKTLYCTGKLPDHKDYHTLREEVSARGITLTELCSAPAEDFGSLLFA
jgi:hypothetical protein